MSALAYAMQFLVALPQLVELTERAKEIYDDTVASLQKMQDENRDPTPDEWALLNTRIDALRSQLQS